MVEIKEKIPVIPLCKTGSLFHRPRVKGHLYLTDDVSTITPARIKTDGAFLYEKEEYEQTVLVYHCNNTGKYSTEGDGSKENPWKSLRYALEKLECISEYICDNQFFLLKLSGMLGHESGGNYSITLSGFNRVFITTDNIDLPIDHSCTFMNLLFMDCVFHEDATSWNMFDSCYFYRCNFNSIDRVILSYDRVNTIIDCNCTGKNPGINARYSTRGSIAYNCTVSGEGAGCTVGGTSFIKVTVSGGSVGFHSGYKVKMIDCNASASGTDMSGGFQDINHSVFFNCSSVSRTIIKVGGYSAGFRNCTNSIFDNCSGDAQYTIASRDPTYFYAIQCGFLNCTDSSFHNCSTTEGKKENTGWNCSI